MRFDVHQPLWWGLVLLPMCAVAAAPDAGQLSRDAPARIGNPAARTEVQIVPREEKPADAVTLPDDMRIRVNSVRVLGVRSLSQSQVQAVVADVAGQELGFRQLRELADRITAFYRSQGYVLAQAYLPAQKIVDGVVEIAVVEGSLGRIRYDLTPPVTEADVAPRLRHLMPGQALRSEDLEQDLLLLDDLPGVRVEAVLRPGEAAGTSDLDVKVQREQTLKGNVILDNYGNRYTGEWRLSGQLNLASPLMFGDSLDLNLSTTGVGYRYARAAWQAPVGHAGTMLGVAGSVMAYRLGKQFSSLDARGRSTTASLYALHPLQRSRMTTLQLQSALEWKRFDDEASNASTTKSTRVWSIGLNGYSNLASGAIGMGMVNLNFGHLRLDDANVAADAAGYRTAGSYAKLSFLGEYSWPWEPGLAGVVRLSGQWAGKNLDSSEQMGLGGIQGVRAYAGSEVSADDALVASFDLRHDFGQGVRGKVFVDAAHGRLRHHPLATDVVRLRHLSGVGFGVDADLPAGLLLQTAVALPVSDQVTQDLNRNPRFWLQLSPNF